MKIAVLGSAVSSVGLAPVNDPSWQIWACSPANRGVPRVDAWFELHHPQKKIQEGLTEWLDFLKTQPKVYMQKALPDYPGAVEYPLEAMLAKWGPYWWTSQIAYMLALAMEQEPEAIGVYGVDMAANSEYNQQRLACQFFIREILMGGKINLVVPPESDILEPAPLYGYSEGSRHWRKLHARHDELGARIALLDQELEQIKVERLQIEGALSEEIKKYSVEQLNARAKSLDELHPRKMHERIHLRGAQDDLEYNIAHWANRRDFY